MEFRKHLSYFPFFDLPVDIDAYQLQLERPYLSQAIHALCTKGLSQQVSLASQLRTTLAIKIVAEGERSVDLLLAVVVCIAWWVDTFRPLV